MQGLIQEAIFDLIKCCLLCLVILILVNCVLFIFSLLVFYVILGFLCLTNFSIVNSRLFILSLLVFSTLDQTQSITKQSHRPISCRVSFLLGFLTYKKKSYVILKNFSENLNEAKNKYSSYDLNFMPQFSLLGSGNITFYPRSLQCLLTTKM